MVNTVAMIGLGYIEASARSIAPVLEKGNLVILEATSPVGTTEKLAQWLAEDRPDLTFPQQAAEAADIPIAHCPERVLPRRVVHKVVSNDRVIGGMTRTATYMLAALYSTFVEGDLVPTSARTAEMCKLTENSFCDLNIAFANELSVICDKLDINDWELISLADRHPRVKILHPGAGVGGHCIAVDPWFIVDATPEEARIIRMAREVNDNKPHWVVAKIKTAITDVLAAKSQETVAGIKVACLGLAFTPDLDDLRESPGAEMTGRVAKLGCHVLAVDPNVEALSGKLAGFGVSLVSLEEALERADVVSVLVQQRSFVEAASSIRNHARAIDAAGLFASLATRQ